MFNKSHIVQAEDTELRQTKQKHSIENLKDEYHGGKDCVEQYTKHITVQEQKDLC